MKKRLSKRDLLKDSKKNYKFIKKTRERKKETKRKKICDFEKIVIIILWNMVTKMLELYGYLFKSKNEAKKKYLL